MDDFQRQKEVLHRLVKARDAIRRKYKLLKYNKVSAEKEFSQTFKPIIQKIASKRKIES